MQQDELTGFSVCDRGDLQGPSQIDTRDAEVSSKKREV